MAVVLYVHFVHSKQLPQLGVGHVQQISSANIVLLELVDDAPTEMFMHQEPTNFHGCPHGRISAGFATMGRIGTTAVSGPTPLGLLPVLLVLCSASWARVLL